MKKLMKIAMIVLAAAVLMQAYRAYMEMKYRCDTLAGQVDRYDILSQALIQSAHMRAHRDAQMIADLETKLEMSTIEKSNQSPGRRDFARRP